VKDCETCPRPVEKRKRKTCLQCLGYDKKGKLRKRPWEPYDDHNVMQLSASWWENCAAENRPLVHHPACR